MTKTKTKKTDGAAVTPVDEPTRDIVRPMNGGTELVPVEAVFHVPEVHPRGAGPWDGEPDKIAWRDRATGLDCIIKRSRATKCLEGFVGVGPDHPLFRVTPGALVGLGLQAHGGINYAANCQKNVPERVSVCHTHARRQRVERSGDGHRVVSEPLQNAARQGGSGTKDHDDAWWFGFSCDHASDLLPNGGQPEKSRDLPMGVADRVYRDEAFVYRECVHLAAQLRAIADGVDPESIARTQPAVEMFDLERGSR